MNDVDVAGATIDVVSQTDKSNDSITNTSSDMGTLATGTAITIVGGIAIMMTVVICIVVGMKKYRWNNEYIYVRIINEVKA